MTDLNTMQKQSKMPDPTVCNSLGTSSPIWLPGLVSALCFERQGLWSSTTQKNLISGESFGRHNTFDDLMLFSE